MEFKVAFDHVSRTILWKAIERIDIRERTEVTKRVGEKVTKPFQTSEKIRLMFTIYILEIKPVLRKKHNGGVVFNDR